MSQSPPQNSHESPHVIERNMRRGMLLFTLYLALYAGFVLMMVFRQDLMAATTYTFPLGDNPIEIYFGGPPLAVVYGIGLILAAIVLALWYMIASGRPSNREVKR